MTQTLKTTAQRYAEITQIIRGKPASPISTLPQIWQRLEKSTSGTALSDKARADYVEAAQLFRYHNTPLAREALSAIGNDFAIAAYPDLSALAAQAESQLAANVISGVSALFAEFGYDVPASFYNIILETLNAAEEEQDLAMFKNKKVLMLDRLRDAVLHAMLLVTPVGLYVQSVLSQHGVRFVHLMNCSCSAEPFMGAPFVIALDADYKQAYLQNLVAASLEQYGVNAATSREGRGF